MAGGADVNISFQHAPEYLSWYENFASGEDYTEEGSCIEIYKQGTLWGGFAPVSNQTSGGINGASPGLPPT